MIALDTNILVQARRAELEHHSQAKAFVRELAEGEEVWAIPWPCIYEFLRIVSHPRIFDPPTSLDAALQDLASLFESPTLVLLGEGHRHPAHLVRMMRDGAATGNLAHDAHIAALGVEHGVKELWTLDRDFSRFPGLSVRDPFRS